jgi:hypothetical protein
MLRALAGLQGTRTPDFSYQYPFPDLIYPNWVTAYGVNLPWTFSYEADAGLKWNFRGRVALLAYAGYDGCRPSKPPAELLLFGPNNNMTIPLNGYKPGTVPLPTGTIHLRAGIEMRL